jgi:hypothetical protein
VANTASKVVKALAKIKEIYEKIEPMLEALGTVFESIKNVTEAIHNAETALNAPKYMKEGDMKLDALNAIAQWSVFDLQIKILETQFEDLGIPSQGDYIFALSQLLINGKTYILSQVDLVTCGDALATVMLRLRQ